MIVASTKYSFWILFFLIVLINTRFYAQKSVLDQYNVVWQSPSANSSESMPCGGGDIGLNVWVENGDILFYISRSGTFDENNGFLKLGRTRLTLFPNPFAGGEFKQELQLNVGNVKISGKANGVRATVLLWVDVFRPVIHVEIKADKPVLAKTVFESWRFADHVLKPGESFANSLKWGPVKNVTTLKDSIAFDKNGVLFYHQNIDSTVFDITVRQQGLQHVKERMFNPLKSLTFGGFIAGNGMKIKGTVEGKYQDTPYKGWILESTRPARAHEVFITLYTAQTPNLADWKAGLEEVVVDMIRNTKTAQAKTMEWWAKFWERSWIRGLSQRSLPPTPSDRGGAENSTNNTDIKATQSYNHLLENIGKSQVSAPSLKERAGGEASGEEASLFRNYHLFRYMLACNAYGEYPTKFNGGLFTVDPVFTDTAKHFTPDYRNWCGGTMTAQNQRLVYFPLIKSGDFDLMKPQFEFYRRVLGNAELRSEVYWGHKGACFTEQLENFGLPNSAEYGWKRPEGFDKGLEYNAWLEYEWDTVLEFCLMILEKERYTGSDISEYLPLITSCLTFFNEHYQYLAKQRGAKAFDGNGHLVLYPGSGAETFKMAYNATSTIAALHTILTRFLELPDHYVPSDERKDWAIMLNRIPPISFREFDGYKTISPAKLWERVNNTETSQLYPVFPWGIYGVGKPDLDIAINTWKYDTLALKFRSHVGWKQDNIWAARLGLTDEAAQLTKLKLKDSGRRFSTFWGPGFDWVPDHNWGGSGMIGLQEMLMQVDGRKIFLFPAWPKDWDVHFKLYAPYNTTVEAVLKDGKLEGLKVIPENRRKDIEILLENI